jgi:catechol 2,3-dioxygenase-like lactoylglutathione lyase family enzyme
MFDHSASVCMISRKAERFMWRRWRLWMLAWLSSRRNGWLSEKPGRAQFWVGTRGSPSSGVHLAFAAANRAEVRAFCGEALGAGGTDNGAPGVRPQYHPNYYGAFVLDPDGHNVEAVCRNPED